MPTESSRSAVADEFLRISRAQLGQKLRWIEACLEQLRPEQIWQRDHETENAVGNLVLHLGGNVRQWIVSGIGGAPDVRQRDREFACRDRLPRAALLDPLQRTLADADAVLAGLTADDLLATRRIQGYELSVLHAIYHVIEHFSGHTGQIIAATKRLTGHDLGFYRYLSRNGGSR